MAVEFVLYPVYLGSSTNIVIPVSVNVKVGFELTFPSIPVTATFESNRGTEGFIGVNSVLVVE